MIELQGKARADRAPSSAEEYNARFGADLEKLGLYERDIPEIGPSPADVAVYSEMLEEAKQGSKEFRDKYKFDPRVAAELVSDRIGDGRLGAFTGSGGDITDPSSRYRLVQQRFIARVLGFQVGEISVNPRDTTASMPVTFPDKVTLPPIPQPDSQGVYRDANGKELNQINVDTYYTAHYLADNKDRFDQPKALYKLFERVTKLADAGEIRIPAAQASDRGRLSLIRQTARVLGYNVNTSYRKEGDSGDVVLDVNGVRPGFENKHSELRGNIERDRRRIGQQATGNS